MLSSNLESPLVPETSVAPDLEQSLHVFSELGFEDVGCHLQVLSLLVVSLPVEEPTGNAVSLGIGNEIGDGITLRLRQFSGPEFGVESEDLADEESKPSADSLDLVECEGDGSLTVDVGVENTVNMLEGVLSVFDDQ